MPLNPDQLATASRWLKTRLLACHSCGGKNFTSGDIILGNVYTPGGGVQIGAAGAPMFQVFCQGCGVVHLYSAEMMGIT